jgi:uncharacterized protein (TIGR03000 family)
MEWKRLLKTQWLLAGLALLLVAEESQAQTRQGGRFLFRRNAEPVYSNYQPAISTQPTTVTQVQAQPTTVTQVQSQLTTPAVTTQNTAMVLQPVTTSRGRFGRRTTQTYVEVPVAQGTTTTQPSSATVATDPRRSFYPQAEADRAAVIDLRLSNPAAQVFFDDRATTQQGTVRQYVTPPLEADKEYTYQVRIRWSPNGANSQPLEETRQVQVKAGGRVQLELSQPTGAAEAAPAPRPATEVPQP